MITIFATIFFILGLIIGSFLNVVIARFNSSKTLGGRSMCMSCESTIPWYDLIPLLSYLFLGGRCRVCKTKISFIYPVVEFLTGLVFMTIFLKFQDILFINTFIFGLTYIYYVAVFSTLLVIAFYDIRHQVIPDQLSLFLGILTFVGLFFFNNQSFVFLPHIPAILDILSGVFIALPFYLIWLVSAGKWMGLGDAKIVISFGWLLGISRALSGVVLAFWIGAVLGTLLVVISKKHSFKSQIPFAPYLVLGAFLAFIFSLSLFPVF